MMGGVEPLRQGSWNTTRSAPPLAGRLAVLDRRSGTQGTGQLAVISWVIGQKQLRKDSIPVPRRCVTLGKLLDPLQMGKVIVSTL